QDMQALNFGRLINVGSVAGFLPASPGNTLYAPIKTFLIGLTRGLWFENKDENIHISLVCPGFTRTEFHSHHSEKDFSRAFPQWFWMDATRVVKIALRQNVQGCLVIIPGFLNHIVTVIIRITPFVMVSMHRK
ncbi:MAG: SDR family NAD(P)-dependent oxidoreductase, partial [Asticcacaulis sp.]